MHRFLHRLVSGVSATPLQIQYLRHVIRVLYRPLICKSPRSKHFVTSRWSAVRIDSEEFKVVVYQFGLPNRAVRTMPRLKPNALPAYRHHKPTGQAVVRFNGRDFYLGRFKTKASLAEYDRLTGEWKANGRQLPDVGITSSNCVPRT
jgi:hypothetical protein